VSARLAWLLLALTAFAVCHGIDRMPLLDPDEGRNAEVAREILAGRDWIQPVFHGLPYPDKPVLYFDAVALSLRAFGIREWAARLPSVLFAAGAALATFLLARTLWDSATARLATVVFATSPLFLGFARIVIFDMALTCFVVLAWWAAERGRRGAQWGPPVAWACIGLAVLTKGPIGLLLGVIGPVAMALGQPGPRRLTHFFSPLGIAVLVMVLAPWVVAMEMRLPGFLRYALLVETVERLTQPTFHRSGPIHYYLPVLLLGFLPWSLVAIARLPASLRALPRVNSAELGAGLAATAIVVFFSLSSSKLPGYVLPAFPWLALLVARAALRVNAHPAAWTVVPGVTLALLGIAEIGAASSGMELAPRLRLPVALEPALDRMLVRIGILALALGATLIALRALRRPGAAPALLALHTPFLAFLIAGPLTAYAEQNASRALARAIGVHGGARDGAVAVHCFPNGIDWYLGRIVPIVTETGGEVTSAYVARNVEALRARHPDILWSESDLAEHLARGDADLLITRRRDAPPAGAAPLGEFGKYLLWRASSTPATETR
jgi:4-amino-4-deoxy-L-arabinose transferase-like glycosyltransferase